MEPSSLQTVTSTLASQPSSSAEHASAAKPLPESSYVPKRTPGRPKGSGKKDTDVTVPKPKRPVGRPRKDGLPAGSVQRSGRPVGRPRKRTSDGLEVAAPQDAHPPPPMFPFVVRFVDCFAFGQMLTYLYQAHASPYGGYLPWTPNGPSTSAIPLPPPQVQNIAYPVDPALDQDGWAGMSQNDPHAFLRKLVDSLSSPNPVSASGSTVEEAFKSHLSSLAPLSKTTPSIPSLYAILKTFWLPSSPAYFSLTASASTARTPSEYRFLYWDPQPLVFNGIGCPNCLTPLINRGRIRSGPLKVHDLNGKPFFVIGCEYACISAACIAETSPEGRKFSSTDTSIFKALPLSLKNEFPARLLQGDTDMGSDANAWNWQAMGVSEALWNMVRGCLKAGLRKDAILNIIRGIQLGVPDDLPKRNQDEGDEDGDGADDDVHQGGNIDGREVSMQVVGLERNGFSVMSFQSLAQDYQQAQNPDDQPKASGSGHAEPSERSPITIMTTHPELAFGASYVSYPYGAHPWVQSQNPDTPVAGSSSPEHMSPKRPFPFAGDGAIESTSASKRIRHCCKCGSSECKGKGGRAFCANACQDCGKVDECKGVSGTIHQATVSEHLHQRNSKRPEKTCAEAWV